ncbi:unnamed protein product, partial [Mycena citricolor]
ARFLESRYERSDEDHMMREKAHLFRPVAVFVIMLTSQLLVRSKTRVLAVTGATHQLSPSLFLGLALITTAFGLLLP